MPSNASAPPTFLIIIGRAITIEIIYTAADITARIDKENTFPSTICSRFTGERSMVASVPLSFSPAIISTPSPIAPAKISIVIK